MSSDYYLMCLDCGVELHFGDVYWIDEDGGRLDACTFTGVYNEKDKTWHKRDEYFGITMEQFLIQHRNHELRFVPEGVDEYLDIYKNIDIEGVSTQDIIENPETETDWYAEREKWKEKLSKTKIR